MAILICIIALSVIFVIVGYVSFGIGHVVFLNSFTQKAYNKIRRFSLLVSFPFILSMIIILIVYHSNTKEANLPIVILFIVEIVILVIYQAIFDVLALKIRRKMVANSLIETMKNYPDLHSFDDIIKTCLNEYREIRYQEAVKTLQKLSSSKFDLQTKK